MDEKVKLIANSKNEYGDIRINIQHIIYICELLNHSQLSHISNTLYKQLQIYFIMKTFSVLLLTTLVAITIERCKAEFLLVEVEEDVKRNDKDVGKITGRLLYFLLAECMFIKAMKIYIISSLLNFKNQRNVKITKNAAVGTVKTLNIGAIAVKGLTAKVQIYLEELGDVAVCTK